MDICRCFDPFARRRSHASSRSPGTADLSWSRVNGPLEAPVLQAILRLGKESQRFPIKNETGPRLEDQAPHTVQARMHTTMILGGSFSPACCHTSWAPGAMPRSLVACHQPGGHVGGEWDWDELDRAGKLTWLRPAGACQRLL